MHDWSIPRTWRIDYGDPSVDFVNSRWNRLKEAHESFASLQDVLDWLSVKGLLDQASFRRWSRRLGKSPGTARGVLRQALALRETLYGIFRSLAEGRRPRHAELRALNRFLVAGSGSPVLSLRSGLRFELTHQRRGHPAAALLGSIAESAARLLAEQDLSRLRRCFNRECGVVFYDRTKNLSRRWCHMRVCGSILKMRRYRARVRAEARTGTHAAPRRHANR